MKAFAIGLIFIIAVSILSGIGMLLYPLIIVFGFFLKIMLAILFVILSIWLLGKFIIFIWERISKTKQSPVAIFISKIRARFSFLTSLKYLFPVDEFKLLSYNTLNKFGSLGLTLFGITARWKIRAVNPFASLEGQRLNE